MKKLKQIGSIFLLWIGLTVLFAGCLLPAKSAVRKEVTAGAETQAAETQDILKENGSYTSRDEVALYLHLYGRLPDNFITKKEAEELGWDSSSGNLWDVAYGKSIGGSRFGNYEGMLPKKNGRQYYECDVEYQGGYRNGKRLVYSNDGLIYYTEDHYQSFELLYGEED